MSTENTKNELPLTEAELNKLRNEAISLHKNNQFNDLDLICNKILLSKPNDAYANYLLGLSLQNKGDIKQAADYFIKAADADSENKIFVLAAANTLMNAERPAEAILYFKKFLLFNHSIAAVYNQIGFLYIAMGRVKSGIPYYKKALKENPNLVEALNNMGNALQELRKKKAAAKYYRKAIEQNSNFSDSHYNLHAVIFHDDNPLDAINELRLSLNANPKNIEAKGYLAMYLDLIGEEKESLLLFDEIDRDFRYFSFLRESWNYVKGHRTKNTRIFSMTQDSLKHAFSFANGTGLILEFGVRYATTLNFIASLANNDVHGFDSFEGIPENWKTEEKGKYTTYGNLPPVYSNVTLHQGWFDNTLTAFCKHNNEPLRFMNIDCDLYSSTRTIFDKLKNRIAPGCVIVFDEYICNPDWQQDEFKAFQEFVTENQLDYEYLLFSPFSKQAAVIIK